MRQTMEGLYLSSLVLILLYVGAVLIFIFAASNPNPSSPVVSENSLLLRFSTSKFVLSIFRYGCLVPCFLVVSMILIEDYIGTSSTGFGPELTFKLHPLQIAICPRYISSAIDFHHLPRHKVLAFTLIFVGSIGRLACFYGLGRSFTYNLSVPRDGLVTTGIYRYIQHPAYTFAVPCFTGMCLLVFGRNGLLCCLIPDGLNTILQGLMTGTWMAVFGLWLGLRVKAEEKLLKKTFEYEWVSYNERTCRFIPGII